MKKKGIIKEIISTLIYMAVVFGLTYIVITFVGQRTYVSGDSMLNTIHDRETILSICRGNNSEENK